MCVRILTDSTLDTVPAIRDRLTVIPLTVSFDGILL